MHDLSGQATDLQSFSLLQEINRDKRIRENEGYQCTESVFRRRLMSVAETAVLIVGIICGTVIFCFLIHAATK